MDENSRNGNIVIYLSEDGTTHLEVTYEQESLWLSQQQICELYQTSKSNVSEHIKHIFEDGELKEDEVVRKFRTTAADGKNYNVTFYNLDMILSIGYRVRSLIASRFRHWAPERRPMKTAVLPHLTPHESAGNRYIIVFHQEKKVQIKNNCVILRIGFFFESNNYYSLTKFHENEKRQYHF